MNPDPFTLRELHAMATAREKAEWDRTAFIVAKIHNANCATQSGQIRDLRKLNPYRIDEIKAGRLSLKEQRRRWDGHGG